MLSIINKCAAVYSYYVYNLKEEWQCFQNRHAWSVEPKVHFKISVPQTNFMELLYIVHTVTRLASTLTMINITNRSSPSKKNSTPSYMGAFSTHLPKSLIMQCNDVNECRFSQTWSPFLIPLIATFQSCNYDSCQLIKLVLVIHGNATHLY